MNKLKKVLKYKRNIFGLKELLNLIITFRKIMNQNICNIIDNKDILCVYHLKSLINRYFDLKEIIGI